MTHPSPAFRGLTLAVLIQAVIALVITAAIWIPHALAAFAFAVLAILWRWSR